MDAIKRKLRTILAGYLRKDLNPADIPEDADIRTLGVDSVGALELFAEIESAFGICFNSEELDFSCQNSIQSIAKLVKAHL